MPARYSASRPALRAARLEAGLVGEAVQGVHDLEELADAPRRY